MSEHDEQVTFFSWVVLNRECAQKQGVKDALELCYGIHNGANLPKKKYKNKKGEWKTWSPEAKWLKSEGALEEGIPDISLDWPGSQLVLGIISEIEVTGGVLCRGSKKILHGLRIEMKYGKNKLSKAQKRKKELLEKSGHKYEVCYSAKEAIQTVIDYLPFEKSDYQGLREFLA